MKTMTLVLLTAAALAGCGKDKKATTTVTQTTTKTTPVVATPPAKPDPVVTGNTQVSGGLSIGGDIATACGIKAMPAGAAPKFDFDKDELGPDDRAVLDQIATCLISGALKGKNVDLIGRADPRGTEEYNLGLGSRRAASVSGYLTRLGVPGAQLGVTTRGSVDATGTDEAGYSQDRRVDIMMQQSES